MDTRPLTNCGRSALTRSTRSSERSGRSRSAAMTSRRSRTTTPIPPSRILDLCGSWICCSRFFPGGCPRIGTRDSRRFGSAWVWHGLRFAGHGETGLRCGASRTWDYASERSAAKSHVRMPSRRHTRLPSIPVDSCRLGLRFGTFRSEIPCADAIFNLTRLSTFE